MASLTSPRLACELSFILDLGPDSLSLMMFSLLVRTYASKKKTSHKFEKLIRSLVGLPFSPKSMIMVIKRQPGMKIISGWDIWFYSSGCHAQLWSCVLPFKIMRFCGTQGELLWRSDFSMLRPIGSRGKKKLPKMA